MLFEYSQSTHDSPVFYPLLVTSGMLWKPSGHPYNAYVAITCRSLKNPWYTGTTWTWPIDEKTLKLNWNLLTNLFLDNTIMSGPVDMPSIQTCAQMMGSRGLRILEAYQKIIMENNYTHPQKASVKTDETINCFKSVDGVNCLVPRLIRNLDPKVHAEMLPYSRMFSDLLHEVFNGQTIIIGKRTFQIYYCSGYSSDQLDNLAVALTLGSNVICVAGDDSIIKCGKFYYEIDMKMFDQSIGPWALESLIRILKIANVPENITNLFYRVCKEDINFFGKDFRIKAKCFPQLATGVAFTTPGNSCLNPLFCLHGSLLDDFEKAAIDLGFNIKMKKANSLKGLTFFKRLVDS